MSKLFLPPLPLLTKFSLPNVYTVATHNVALMRRLVLDGQNKKTGGTDFERKETESLLGWKIFVVVDFGSSHGARVAVQHQSVRSGGFRLCGGGEKGAENDGAVCHGIRPLFIWRFSQEG